jgi:2,5-diamino-6-(ribosylamino)-4(3H)-pyrimidinone 5'-phosphate reductase
MNPADRPFVFINVAVTADGKTDTVARQGAKISSPPDAERVDRLRAASDAVMVGGHTLLGDDPRLTVRSEALRAERRARGAPENPVKVGVVSRVDFKPDSRFLSAGPAAIRVFTTQQSDPARVEALRARGVQVSVVGEQRVDLAAALAELKRAGIERLMVEGGGTLNAELLRLGLVDELCVYLAPLIFGGATAPTLADGPGLARAEAVPLRLLQVESWPDGGILIHFQVNTQRKD